MRSSRLPSFLLHCSIALATFAISPVTRADPHPMALGAASRPAAATAPVEIAIRAETLRIKVSGDHADVVADIELQNAGPARTLDVGFPCDGSGLDDIEGSMVLGCKTKLRVTADGKSIPNRVVGKERRREYAWKMQFAAGATTKLRVSYRAPLVNDRYDVPYAGALFVLYRLTTGAEWAGPIGKLDMEIELPTDAVAWIGPPGYTRTPKHIRWQLTDYEPAEDVVVLMNPLLNSFLFHFERKLGKAKGAARERALATVHEEVRERGMRITEMQSIAARLLPLFHIEPPKAGIPETMTESMKLIEEGLPRD